MSYISATLRQAVIERADNCCEYCLLSQEDNFFPFEVDHIRAEKHGGASVSDNLAWSCSNRNGFKGSDIGSIDPFTDKLTPLFNPRLQVWSEHFRLDGARIEPLTPEGRVTVFLLRLNRLESIAEHEALITLNRYPYRNLEI
jgi:hypothetical protein